MRSFLSVLVVLAACDHSSSETPDARIIVIDSAVDAPPVAPNTVTVRTYGTPLFIKYRDGSSAWQSAKQVDTGTYEIAITNDYEVVVVCGSDQGFDSTLFKRTFADGSRFTSFCFDGGPLPSSINVSGTMAQPGTVFMQDQATGTTAPWSFSLSVTPGDHDLIAVGGHRIVIVRGIQVNAPMTFEVRDLNQVGLAMTAKPLTINTLTGETLNVDYSLLLENDYATLPTTGTTAYVAPDTLLEPNDLQFLDVFATTATTFRNASVLFTGSETTFDLMPPLTGVTFAASSSTVTASWGALPTHSSVGLMFMSTSNGPSTTAFVRATTTWIAAKAVSQLSWDAEPPGFDSAWSVNLAGGHDRMFIAYDTSSDVVYSTGVVDHH